MGSTTGGGLLVGNASKAGQWGAFGDGGGIIIPWEDTHSIERRLTGSGRKPEKLRKHWARLSWILGWLEA